MNGAVKELVKESGTESLKESEHLDFNKIATKVYSGERLSYEDGILLFNHPNILEVGMLANYKRELEHRNTTFYNKNLHLNVTNVCEADCIFCSFSRIKTGDKGAFTFTTEQAKNWIKERYRDSMTEIHIVNGLNPDLPFSYYLELLRMIKREYPALHIKAFTAVEIHYFSKLYNLSYREVLEQLVEAGLGSLPGGGAEIFDERVRRKIAREKADQNEWLAVHREAHLMGLKSNCTMLFGHIEKYEERVDHLIKLRALQDETGGFQAFIPLSYHPENNRLGKIGAPTAQDELRTVAVSRLMLDNIKNIKAYWIMLGVKTAQTALSFGANDLDGTVMEEKIYHMAGSKSPDSLTENELHRLIRDAGRVPVERSTTYEIIKTY